MTTDVQSPLLAALDQEIAVLAGQREEVQVEMAAVKERLAAIDKQVLKLNKMRAEITGERFGPARRVMDAATVAGPKALATVEEFMSRFATVKQRDITAETGLNSGTVSYALRALADQGKVRRTGRTFGRSPEWEIVPKRTRVKPTT